MTRNALQTSVSQDGQTGTWRVMRLQAGHAWDVSAQLRPHVPCEPARGSSAGGLGVRLPTAAAPDILLRYAGTERAIIYRL